MDIFRKVVDSKPSDARMKRQSSSNSHRCIITIDNSDCPIRNVDRVVTVCSMIRVIKHAFRWIEGTWSSVTKWIMGTQDICFGVDVSMLALKEYLVRSHM